MEVVINIETDLTEEEREVIMSGIKEYKEHPENFSKLEDVNWL